MQTLPFASTGSVVLQSLQSEHDPCFKTYTNEDVKRIRTIPNIRAVVKFIFVLSDVFDQAESFSFTFVSLTYSEGHMIK